MNCTHDNVGELRLDAVVDAASTVYARHDRNRSLWDVWSHALHHAAAIAEEIRKLSLPAANDGKLRQEIADLALWLFAMIAKLKGPLGSPVQINEVPQDSVVRISVNASDLMWNRYPGVCPWCYCAVHAGDNARIDEADFGRPCCCDSLGIAEREKQKEELRARAKRTRLLAKEHMSRRPRSIDDWQNLIGNLYRQRLGQMTPSDVALHLLEEMGEVSDGLIRMYTYSGRDSIEEEIFPRRARLEDELADVLSWLFGIVECLELRKRSQPNDGLLTDVPAASTVRLRLSQILWARYGSDEKHTIRCFHCGAEQCVCDIQLIQSKEQVEDLLAKLSKSPSPGFV